MKFKKTGTQMNPVRCLLSNGVNADFQDFINHKDSKHVLSEAEGHVLSEAEGHVLSEAEGTQRNTL